MAIEYKTDFFGLEELVHPQIIRTIGRRNAWRRLDADCLRDLDIIRDEWYKIHGTGIYCNVDVFDSRGLRPPNDPDGSFYSTHKHGTTFDLVPINGKVVELYNFVINLIKNGKLQSLNTLEHIDDTKRSWVHVAKMNTDQRPLIIRL